LRELGLRYSKKTQKKKTDKFILAGKMEAWAYSYRQVLIMSSRLKTATSESNNS